MKARAAAPTLQTLELRRTSLWVTTKYLKRFAARNDIRKKPEYKTLGLRIVNDKKLADLEIQLDRTSPISFFYTFSVFNPETGILVTSGKTLSWDGHKAATEMATEIVKQIQAARAPAASQTKK